MSKRSHIPEFRASAPTGVLFDLSVEDSAVLPLEPEASSAPPGWEGAGDLKTALGSLVRPGARVLLFEPTRPDIREAIVDLGASYIDGGRLLCGTMDPAVLAYFEARELDLVILEVGDGDLGGITAPVLVDARSKPYRPDAVCGDFHVLYALGLRDGFSRSLGVWVQKSGSGVGLAGDLANVLAEPGFDGRALKRHGNLESGLDMMLEHAKAAGFEASVRAGYVWLAVPGFSSSQIQRAFSENDLGVFACDHHPYRHRVRLAPPGGAVEERLQLIFLASYKSLTSCE